MDKTHKVTMLGTGLIGMFYTMTLHGQRSRDRVHVVYSRTEERAKDFAAEWDIPKSTTNLAEAINDSGNRCRGHRSSQRPARGSGHNGCRSRQG